MCRLTAFELVKKFNMGWNIGNSLDACKCRGLESEISWNNPYITDKLIDNVCSSGFDIIRIPVTWYNHFIDESCTIDPLWLERVKHIVDYTYNKGVYVILNTHHEDWIYMSNENYANASFKQKSIWTQLAKLFSSYGERLIFENMNEPRKFKCPDEWTGGDAEARAVINKLNAEFVDTIRSFGGNNAERFLMLAAYCGCCTDKVMRELEIPNDDRIIATVHSYQPWCFAAAAEDAPDFTKVFAAEDKNFTKPMDETFDFMKKYCIDKKIPVIIGEFGAVYHDNNDERLSYINYFKKKLDEYGVKAIWWDNGYTRSFGLFDRKSGEPFYNDIISALIKKSD